MKISFLMIVFSSFFLLSCTHKAIQTKKLDNLFYSYWEEHNKFFPIDATSQGDNRYNDSLVNDQTPEFRESLKNYYQKYLTELSGFNRSELSDNDKMSFDIFRYEILMQLEGLKSIGRYMPFQQFWGLPLTMGQLGAGENYQPFKTVQDYENWLKRIKGFVAWSNSAMENFREGIKAGVVLPRVLVLKIIPQMQEMIVTDPIKSLYYTPIKKFPESFSETQKAKLTEDYKIAIMADIVPVFTKWKDFFQKEYLPKSRLTDGISALPGGEKEYTYLVKYWTTTEKTPEEIYQIGLSEVSRIRIEMEKVKKQVGFKGSLKQFFASLRKDPKLTPFKSAGEILNFFHGINQKIQPKLATMFGRVPKTPFEIRQTEEFRAASASAEYNQGSADGSRPGIFYIPILDPKTFNITSGMESLFLHEAIPGHHYQFSLQQENDKLPSFRRFSWYGAYGEGWALYTESLGKELGLYTDPYQYMGALGDEMHRAVRLVVDVGIHLKGMTRKQAIDYMMANEPISKDGAVAEIERYMAIPGQALSYKIGALKIRELRNKYAQAQGEKFSLSSFHDEFLKDGCMPLAVSEEKMNAWSEAKK